MKKNEFIKKVIDTNIADKDKILYNTLNGFLDQSVNQKVKIRFKKITFRFGVSFALIAIIISVGIFSDVPFVNKIQTSKNKNSPQNDVAMKQESHIFTLVAYAMDNKSFSTYEASSNINSENKIVLKSNVKIPIPNGKIKRGKYSSSINYKGTRDEGYSSEITFTGLVCTGENIETVTYTSVTDKLSYFDYELAKKMEATGEEYICRIPVSRAILNPDWGFEKVKSVFYKMWSAGEFDEYKNKVFNGKDIDLDNYDIGFQGSGKGISESLFMTIQNKGTVGHAYIKSGTVVVVKAGDSVQWEATNAISKIMGAGAFKYEDLPGDTITVAAKFTDGQIITQTLELSFDKEGNILALIKDNEQKVKEEVK